MPLGFHADGVPVQGTMRQESLDFLTINMPTNKQHKDFRVPFTVIQAAFHFNYETKRAILDVLLWSLGCLKKGKYPTCRLMAVLGVHKTKKGLACKAGCLQKAFCVKLEVIGTG
jgi:hypothetical protein